MRWFFALFGYRILYRCEWGEYEYRYDVIDRQMGRPIHKDMSVAPPWAKAVLMKMSA
jgi:hypothetical protein